MEQRIQHRISELQNKKSQGEKEGNNSVAGEELDEGGGVFHERGSEERSVDPREELDEGGGVFHEGGSEGSGAREEFDEGGGEGGDGDDSGGSYHSGEDSYRGSTKGDGTSDDEIERPVKRHKRSSVCTDSTDIVCTPNKHSTAQGRSPHLKDTSRNSTPTTAELTPTWGRRRGERRPRKKGMHVNNEHINSLQVAYSLHVQVLQAPGVQNGVLVTM